MPLEYFYWYYIHMKKHPNKITPLAVRMSTQEKIALSEAAQHLGCTRNALIRHAAIGVVQELREVLAA